MRTFLATISDDMPASLIKFLTPLLIILACAGIYALLDANRPLPVKEEVGPRPLSVHTSAVEQRDVSLRVQTTGEVRARTEINLATQVGGRVVEVSREFTEGGSFGPGDILLKIEDTDYQLALHQAEARVAGARVQLKQALADADVARKQLRNEANASDLALKKPQVAEAEASLAAAEADLEQAQLNLQRTDVSLPFQGRIISTMVDVGQYVGSGTVVAEAFGTETVEIRLPLDDSQLASLGLPIGYAAADEGLLTTLSARVAGKPHRWQGRLVRLDASVDPDTRTLYGIVEVHDPYGENSSASGMPLAVGLYVEASIEGRELKQAFVIPRDALRAGNQVFLIDSQDQLQIREVDVIHTSREHAIIASSLLKGEQVVTSPVRNPVEGMRLLAIDAATVAAKD